MEDIQVLDKWCKNWYQTDTKFKSITKNPNQTIKYY